MDLFFIALFGGVIVLYCLVDMYQAYKEDVSLTKRWVHLERKNKMTNDECNKPAKKSIKRNLAVAFLVIVSLFAFSLMVYIFGIVYTIAMVILAYVMTMCIKIVTEDN